jgi:hypothetical protein
MDQVKAVGQWIKRNYFWLLCGIVTLASLGFWFASTSSLQAEAEQRRAALEGKESSANSIRSRANHPNTVTHARMDERNNELVEDVYAIWNEQYDRQRAILTWPESLSSEFRAVVSRLQPIEQKVQFPAEREELSFNQRTAYRDFIHMELPNLAKIIGAEWQGGTGAGGLGGGGAIPGMDMGGMGMDMPGGMDMGGMGMGMGGMGMDMPGGMGMGGMGPMGRMGGDAPRRGRPGPLVDWKANNQKALQGNRFSWPTKRGGVPSTLDVLYAQEDYWIYSAVLEIIRAANGDISHRYQAAVKTIDFIDIGRDAIGVAGRVMRVGSERRGMGDMMDMPGGMGDMMGMPGGMGDMMSMMPEMMGGSAGDGSGTRERPQIDPGDNRYVNLQYEPLTAAQIRSAFDSTNPDDAFLMVAKRVPVRMRLKVDQRKLPRLIAECGNADFQLEVRQVRINCRSGSSARQGGMGGGMGGMMGGMDMGGMMPGGGDASGMDSGYGEMMGGMDMMGGMPGGDMMGGMMGGMMPGGMGGGTRGRGLTDDSPFDVDVELYGIMYIYNPVDREKLGKKLDESNAEDLPEQEADEESPSTAEAPATDGAEAASSAG